MVNLEHAGTILFKGEDVSLQTFRVSDYQFW